MLIRGVVTDEQGKPLPWASVAFHSGPVDLPDIAAVSNDAGVFALTAPVPGRYRLNVHADDHEGRAVDVDVGAAEVAVTVQLTRSGG